MKKLSKMKEEASQQEQVMQDLVEDLVQSDGFDQDTIDEKAEETAEKASEIMETYLGDEPDAQEASQLFYGIFIYNKF